MISIKIDLLLTLFVYTLLLSLCVSLYLFLGFSGNSAGKESTCYEGHPGSIPGLGSAPGEGIGYPLHSSVLGFPWWLRR